MPFERTIDPDKKSACRSAYESSTESCRAIGEREGIDGPTVQTWARREGWTRPGIPKTVGIQRKARVALERKVESLVESKAIALSDRAVAFKERAIVTSEKFMNTLERLSEQLDSSNDLDPELVQKAISAHKMMIDTGFKVHGLDADRQSIKIGLFLPVQAVTHQPNMVAIDVTSVSSTEDESSK